jgi:hypothetical protein
MTRRIPPGAELGLANLSTEPKQRHEELVDLFGQYVFWIRNWTIESTRQLVESPDAQQQLSTIFREPYEEAAKLSSEDRERALKLAESSVDAFIILLLRTFAHRGIDFLFGSRHAVRYRLEMEIVDQETDEVVHEEVINRDGRKHFADYWGRWLNRHRKK